MPTISAQSFSPPPTHPVSFQGNLLRQHDVACDETISGRRPCENPKTLDRDGTSYSFKTALGAHTVRLFDCEIELKNIFLSRFEFQFSQAWTPGGPSSAPHGQAEQA